VSVVRFTQAALDDIAGYEVWRTRQGRGWRLIGDELVDAIVAAVGKFESYESVPVPPLSVRGQRASVKRLLVTVRAKAFRVYVGPAREQDGISVRRVRHPGRRPIE
jgi:hypothetical protein